MIVTVGDLAKEIRSKYIDKDYKQFLLIKYGLWIAAYRPPTIFAYPWNINEELTFVKNFQLQETETIEDLVANGICRNIPDKLVRILYL